MRCDVVIIGAGVAGLSAAAALRSTGLDTLVLEATHRIGGRARTVPVGGEPFDLGASWLHNADANPLTTLARAHGDRLVDSDGARQRRRYIDGALATDADIAEYEATYDAVTDMATARALAEHDVDFATAIDPLRQRPWTATVEYWEASLIAAADPRRLSVRDWYANLLDGANLEVGGGIGAFVARRLGPAAGPVRHGAPATRIAWDAPGGRVAVDTPLGRVTADACIVTVSTGVLGAGRIGFDPALPARTMDAIAALPMGLLTKIALPATGADRLGLPDGTSLQRRLRAAGDAVMSFRCWPFGRGHVTGFVGGPAAWQLAAGGPGAVEDFARAQLRAMLGAGIDRALGPATVSSWAVEPEFLGSYAYATPGHADARGVLGEPLAGGRLVFAGEATCTDGLAGTVGGACLSGRRAAAIVHAALGERVAP